MDKQSPELDKPKQGFSTLARVLVAVFVVIIVVQVLFSITMHIPAAATLSKFEDTSKGDLTIKVTGYQWRWHYEYLDSGINFFSASSERHEELRLLNPKPISPQNENELINNDVDNVLLVPSGRKVRMLITSNDVIHSWWVPDFGVKKDAIPGYINEIWINVNEGKEGVYRGECAELCGIGHSYMPIVVKVTTSTEFDRWLASKGRVDEQATESM